MIDPNDRPYAQVYIKIEDGNFKAYSVEGNAGIPVYITGGESLEKVLLAASAYCKETFKVSAFISIASIWYPVRK